MAVMESAFGRGNGPIWMDDVRCIGNESDIITCQHFGPRDQNCGHDEDVGVICQTAESGKDHVTLSFKFGYIVWDKSLLSSNLIKDTKSCHLY